jgi:hypothetical protein
MVAPYTLILTPNGSKKAWRPWKTPQNDGHNHNTTNSLKYKKRRIRRRSIVRGKARDLVFHCLCGPVERKKPWMWAAQVKYILFIFRGWIISSEAAMGGGGGAQHHVWCVNEPKKTGARSQNIVLTWYYHPQQVPQAATVAQARRLGGLAQGLEQEQGQGQELACPVLPR